VYEESFYESNRTPKHWALTKPNIFGIMISWFQPF